MGQRFMGNVPGQQSRRTVSRTGDAILTGGCAAVRANSWLAVARSVEMASTQAMVAGSSPAGGATQHQGQIDGMGRDGLMDARSLAEHTFNPPVQAGSLGLSGNQGGAMHLWIHAKHHLAAGGGLRLLAQPLAGFEVVINGVMKRCAQIGPPCRRGSR